MSWSGYFRSLIVVKKGFASLAPLDAPCVDANGKTDCAVVGCLYMDIAQALTEEPIDVQDEVLRTWFCHNHPDRGCRGAVNLVMAARKGKP